MAKVKNKKVKEFTTRKEFIPLAERKKSLLSYDTPGRDPYSPEIEEHIESYRDQISYLESCKKSIANVFSLLESEKKSVTDSDDENKQKVKFPNEYKTFFLSKALILATPFILGVGTYILSIKSGGFSQLFTSATFPSFFKSLLAGGIFGIFVGGADYARNRLLNTENRINEKKKKFEEKNKKRLEKLKQPRKSILFSIHDKVEKRRLALARMTYDVEKELDNVIAGDPSFFIKDGKLKDCFSFLPRRKKKGLLNALKEIQIRNDKLDALSVIADEIKEEKVLRASRRVEKEVTLNTSEVKNNEVREFTAEFSRPLNRKDQEEDIAKLKEEFKKNKSKK